MPHFTHTEIRRAIRPEQTESEQIEGSTPTPDTLNTDNIIARSQYNRTHHAGNPTDRIKHLHTLRQRALTQLPHRLHRGHPL